MYCIITLFDYNKHLPLLSLVHNKDDNTTKWYKLYHPGTGMTLYEVEQNKAEIIEILSHKKVICNDFKTHVKAFDLPRELLYDAYDMACEKPLLNSDFKISAASIAEIFKTVKDLNPEPWMKLLADAAIPYQFLEDTGYLHFGKISRPNFMLDTYTGRARSLGFSIHGTNHRDDLRPIDPYKDVFVHFDWVSADIRFGSIISKDEELNEVFKASDPYSYIADCLGDMSREDVKAMFLAAMYNRSYDDPIFDLYPDFAAWMRETGEKADKNEPVYNIIGRPFVQNADHNVKAAINAVLQGSVASATHAAMRRIYDLDREILFTDIYDSIVCVCNKRNLKEVIDVVGAIVYEPFKGLVDIDCTLPYKVNVGVEWCKWKEYKVVR